MLRYIVARNIRHEMERVFSAEPTKTDREKALAKSADVSLSTVGRIVSGETGASIDSLERIAFALGVTVTDLLVAPPEVKRALGFKDHD